MLKVLLTHPPTTHTYYAEMIAAQPPGVAFVWNQKPLLASIQESSFKKIAVLILRSLGLPNLRFVRRNAVNDVDVIHSCQNLLLANRPWVVDIEHGCPFVGIHFSRLQKVMTRKIIKLILASQFCQAILPWTNTAAEGLLKTLDRDEVIAKKIQTVYPAVQTAERIDYKERSDELKLLFVVNYPEWNFFLKGGRELIEAYRILRPKTGNLSLIVVGPVPSSIVSECSRVPGILLPGKVSRSQLYQLYRKSAIYVMPSYSDTFGMVFLEAMAFGLPIVALNRPYTAEIVKDGETGLLVELPASSLHWFDASGRPRVNSDTFIKQVLHSDVDIRVVEGLVEKIGCLIEDHRLRKRMGTNGYEEIVSGRFSVARRNQMLRQVYMEAATRSITGHAV